jgi:hypothetical protein
MRLLIFPHLYNFDQFRSAGAGTSQVNWSKSSVPQRPKLSMRTDTRSLRTKLHRAFPWVLGS